MIFCVKHQFPTFLNSLKYRIRGYFASSSEHRGMDQTKRTTQFRAAALQQDPQQNPRRRQQVKSASFPYGPDAIINAPPPAHKEAQRGPTRLQSQLRFFVPGAHSFACSACLYMPLRPCNSLRIARAALRAFLPARGPRAHLYE